MFTLLTNLFDRCVFTFFFIIGVQLPEFIQQYAQRLSGHLNEALLQLNAFQLIANHHFDGNLSLMIEKYTNNSEPSIKETGHLILSTSNRVSELQAHLFLTEHDSSMIQATLQQFQLAIPLNLSALSTGTIFALIILSVNYVLLRTIKKLILTFVVKNSKAV